MLRGRGVLRGGCGPTQRSRRIMWLRGLRSFAGPAMPSTEVKFMKEEPERAAALAPTQSEGESARELSQ
eukprot:2997391-Alexandrium_andersonii.AAC.1